MSRTLLQAVARKAESLTPDADLLSRFARDGDQTAFEELVRRHGPLVWAVCRHLLPDHADAEDAFQAVFLALVRSARTVRDGRALPAWLHGVAVRAATRVKRSIARRKAREQKVARPEASRPVSDGTWNALLRAAHEEVQHLPEAERVAFVLCDLEGVPQPDAAARLGWPLGSLSGRLCKARQRLLDRLAARGIAPTAAVGIGLAAGGASAVPTKLFDVVKTFPRTPGAASAAVTGLARGLTEGLTMRAKLMATATVLVAAVGLTGGAALLSHADAQSPDVVREIKDLTGAMDAQEPGRGRPGSGAPSPGGSGAPGLPPGGAFPGGMPGGTGPGMGGPGGLGSSSGPVTPPVPNVEHKFVDIKSDRKAFEAAIAQHGNAGWEFCGSERFGQGELTLVFKKVKPTSSPFMGSASGGAGSEGGSATGAGSGRSTQDPERGWQMLQRLTNSTGDTVDLGSIPPQTREWLKGVTERSGGIPLPESGTMTKAQYLDYHARNEAARAAAGSSGGNSPGGNSRTDTPGSGGSAPRSGRGGFGGSGMDGRGSSGGSSGGTWGSGGSPSGGWGNGPAVTPPSKFLNVFPLKVSKADEMILTLKPLFPNTDLAADPRTNTILVRGDEKTLDELRTLITRLEGIESAKPK
ncbi:ECF RNA polymerase sigma factor SigE [Gemmata obscuriglobus]|uniref:RNA polymerase sigma factor SigM n=1 Tax=Gemmata obscuriglobus TaxID=114 RepID=A0A2Z3HEG7_9BACT|nr:sigma-70 family RNA polymerase sigma factor [Gemmata obscuriglobus]AWM40114.1 RNA polymerase sigma factor SigM [Gemmata obscuriglobus]QEG26716.1 ECF RNA polymerase sigma factor SigE [Gemmata obscuriglobus]VTS02438.1 sigma-70 family rna polymerase sigma factor : RNA polymerase sigma factor, sigma-70 family OS=Singulisphaera acidiphila (strain ATCC BAA-1392 / DSM 18658 / VKM B-2454 / MOB10) GN=Sinac_5383 PE=4 SV=1: Sigma70_r2: Sigma70_r4_2: Secretin_N [Gemmata obscuriglobus UQM 2246]